MTDAPETAPPTIPTQIVRTTVIPTVIPAQRCGSPVEAVVPGADPCGHSVFRSLCCVCAGCSNDVWYCGRPQAVTVLSDELRAGLTSRRAIVTAVLVLLLMLATGLLQALIYWTALIVVGGTLAYLAAFETLLS